MGQKCGELEGPCYINPKLPWFMKIYSKNTTEYIELRVCGNQSYINEDTLDIIKVYFHFFLCVVSNVVSSLNLVTMFFSFQYYISLLNSNTSAFYLIL